jgi:hypothetical protein
MTNLPKGYKSIGVKWVHKKKMTPQGTIERQGETHSQRVQINWS